VTLKSLRLREPGELIRARATPFSPCRAPFRCLVGEQLIVDAFARYRVIDPLKYYQTIGA